MKRRLTAILLIMCMTLTLIPSMAYADTDQDAASLVSYEEGLCEHHPKDM